MPTYTAPVKDMQFILHDAVFQTHALLIADRVQRGKDIR